VDQQAGTLGAAKLLTVLIAGATGYLGSSTATYLESAGQHLTRLSRDEIWNTELWPTKPASSKQIFLFAAGSVRHPSTSAEAELYVENYVSLVNQSLRMAAKTGVARYIFLSSGDIYGSNEGRPFSEADIHSPTNVYGDSRSRAERLVETWALESGVELIIVRPFQISGKNQKGRFLFELVSSLQGGRTFVVRNPNFQRDFVALSDFHAFIKKSLTAPIPNGAVTVNASSGIARNLGSLAQDAQKILGGKIELVNQHTGLPIDFRVGSNQVASEIFNWTPKVLDVYSLIKEVMENGDGQTPGYDTCQLP